MLRCFFSLELCQKHVPSGAEGHLKNNELFVGELGAFFDAK